jgi:hypothetical protein
MMLPVYAVVTKPSLMKWKRLGVFALPLIMASVDHLRKGVATSRGSAFEGCPVPPHQRENSTWLRSIWDIEGGLAENKEVHHEQKAV